MFAIGFRPFYLLAAVSAVVAILAWLLSYTQGYVFGTYLSGMLWHSHEMVFGFLAAVIAGFLFTAVRNWTGLQTPAGLALGAMVLLWLLARALLLTGPAWLAALVDVAFLPVVAVAIAIPIIKSRNRRNYKVIALVVAVSALHAVFHLGLHGEVPAWAARQSLFAAIDCIVILYAVVGGRVIPAFTRSAVPGSTPRHHPAVEIAAFAFLVALTMTTLVRGAVDLALVPAVLALLAAAAHGVRLALWQPMATKGNPLLWMLPLSYAWLPFALLLRSLSGFGIVLPGTWFHALTAGGLASLIIAMMMRSTLGHTGRQLVADKLSIAAFLTLQAGAVLRVVAPSVGEYRAMVVASGVVWALALVLFLVRYAPMLVRPRIDGKPG